MSHTVNDLRAALFAQMDCLRNPKRDISEEVSKARAMADISRVILESAKLEIEHARLIGGSTVEFLGGGEPATKRLSTGTVTRDGNVLRHTMAG